MRLLKRFLPLLLLGSCTTTEARDTRFPVLILDTGIDLKDPYFKPFFCKRGHNDFTGKGLQDVHGHGTNIAGLILKDINPSRVCIKVVKFWHDRNMLPEEIEAAYLKAAGRLYDADYHLFNFSGNGVSPLRTEERSLQVALGRGAYVVVAAGNEKINLGVSCTSYPACYKSLQKYQNFHVVTDNGLEAANKGGPAKYNENGRGQCYKDSCLNGTSQATANHTNRLLKSLGYGYNGR